MHLDFIHLKSSLMIWQAIFAIPKEQNVLFPSMADHGRLWFVIDIFIISIFTYVLAIHIGSVLEFLEPIFRYVWMFLIFPFSLLWKWYSEKRGKNWRIYKGFDRY